MSPVLYQEEEEEEEGPHDRLLHKMEFYGARQNTLEWIKQFLTNRTQSVIRQRRLKTLFLHISGRPSLLKIIGRALY
jgi:hypothetical protein